MEKQENMELSMDAQQKIDTFKMLYDNVEMMTFNILQYTNDMTIVIYDIVKDKVIYELDTYNTIVAGKFVVCLKDKLQNNMEITIRSMEENIEKVVYSYDTQFTYRHMKGNVRALGTDLISVRATPFRCVILNTKLQEIMVTDDTFFTFGIDDTVTKTVVSMRTWRKTFKLCYNKEHHCATSYDSKTIDNTEYDAIACEFDIDKGIIRTKTGYKEPRWADDGQTEYMGFSGMCKYRLSKYDNMISEKAYNCIIKTYELMQTNYMLVFNYGNKSKPMYGLINEQGKELIEPIYSNISFIGGDIFMLEYKSNNILFSLTRGLLAGPSPLNMLYIHKSLPLSVHITEQCTVNLIDNTGQSFSASELSKHFECQYLKSEPSTIRVKVGGVNKYIDNRLTPITNMQFISRLDKTSDEAWVKM